MESVKVGELWIRVRKSDGTKGWIPLSGIGEALFDTVMETLDNRKKHSSIFDKEE